MCLWVFSYSTLLDACYLDTVQEGQNFVISVDAVVILLTKVMLPDLSCLLDNTGMHKQYKHVLNYFALQQCVYWDQDLAILNNLVDPSIELACSKSHLELE